MHKFWFHLGWSTKFWIRFCIKSVEKDYFNFFFSSHFSGAFIYGHKIIHSQNILKIKTMTTVSYDYGLSDGSFTLFNKQEYFIDSGCLIYGLR